MREALSLQGRPIHFPRICLASVFVSPWSSLVLGYSASLPFDGQLLCRDDSLVHCACFCVSFHHQTRWSLPSRLTSFLPLVSTVLFLLLRGILLLLLLLTPPCCCCFLSPDFSLSLVRFSLSRPSPSLPFFFFLPFYLFVCLLRSLLHAFLPRPVSSPALLRGILGLSVSLRRSLSGHLLFLPHLLRSLQTSFSLGGSLPTWACAECSGGPDVIRPALHTPGSLGGGGPCLPSLAPSPHRSSFLVLCVLFFLRFLPVNELLVLFAVFFRLLSPAGSACVSLWRLASFRMSGKAKAPASYRHLHSR